MKKGFSLLELIVVILLLSLIYIEFKDYKKSDDLELVTNRLVLYLKHLRHQALIDNKYEPNDKLWYMKRWSLKFLRCKNDTGLYYSIYSDANKTGQIAKSETLKDPLTNKYIYSSNSCKENQSNSKYVLLTNLFNITDINLSCNSTSSLGQISFGSNGRVYTKLSKTQDDEYSNLLTQTCIITLKTKEKERKIQIEATGYIKRVK